MQPETDETNRKENSAGSKLLRIAAGALLYLAFFFLSPDDPQRMGAIVVCLVGGVTAAAAFWKYKRQLWFWFTLASMAVVEAGLIAYVSWPKSKFPGALLTPIGLADFALVYGVLKLVQRSAIRSSWGTR